MTTHDPQTMADTLRAYAENSLYSEVMKSGAQCIEQLRAERDDLKLTRTTLRNDLADARAQLTAKRVCPQCGETTVEC